jgi:hypothetical protein
MLPVQHFSFVILKYAGLRRMIAPGMVRFGQPGRHRGN